MFPLFETICIKEGIVQNLSYHLQRYYSSYLAYYGYLPDLDFTEQISIPESFKLGIKKLKVLYNENEVKLTYEDYSRRPVNTLKLVEDNQIDYGLKYTDRSRLNELLNWREAEDMEILIVKNGFITDTSYSNITFFDGNQWCTPAQPLLKGTARARLLREGKITERDIKVEDLKLYQKCKLINAMKDFEREAEIDIGNVFY